MARTLRAKLDAVDAVDHDRVDTTLLLEELKRRYRKESAPLEVSFRDIVSWVRQGDQLTHLLHPYPAKLLPHIAHFFAHASGLRRNGPYILDPFAGSGTVALEASLAGATALVADSNPLALLLSKVKTTPYDTEALVEQAQRLSTRIARIRTAPSISVVNANLWYLNDTKLALERVLRAVMEVEDEDLRDFFRVCFSVTARRLSQADPSISVPVRLLPKRRMSETSNKAIREHLRWLKTASPAEEFAKVVQANTARVLATNRAFRDRTQCVQVGRDARNLSSDKGLPLPSNSISLTVTSPPYGSAQKYIRSSSLALNWLSLCEPTALSDLEGKSIGREHLPSRFLRPQPALSSSVSKIVGSTLAEIRLRNAHRAAITETYLAELTDALREIVRVTSPGGHVVLVVGNNTVAGLTVANDEVIAGTMQDMGLQLELVLRDRIHSRGLLTTRHPTASVISGETILLFRK
jgi:enoyl-CoA hydratase/carnithine racemase